MLTVSLATDTTKTVAFNNTLETFTFRDTCYVYPIAFSERFDSNSVSEVEFALQIFEFNKFTFRSCVGFFKVA